MNTPAPASSPNARASLREWTALAVLALPCLLYSMDLSVLYLAVPELARDLRPSAVQMLWIVDIYGFMVAGLLVTMGTLGDRIGRRRLLLIGAVAFGAMSVLAAFAQTANQLIVARALLGVSAATLAPSTMSLIRSMFHDEHERAIAIGVWMAAFSAGGALGPVIGGFLIEHFWWGSVFLIAVPVMLLLLAVGPLLLPEYKDPAAGRLDLPSALLSIAALLGLTYAIKHTALRGPDLQGLASLAAGLLIGRAFVRRQRRLADPMIDLSLLTNRTYAGCLTINVLMLFIVFGVFLFVAQYFQSVLGMTPLQAGWWMLPSGLIFASGSIVSPLLIRHIHPARLIGTSFAITALGFALLSQVRMDTPFALFMAGYLLFCAGLTPIGAVTVGIAMTAAPPERAGAAAAISETSFELGGAVGIAVLGSLLGAVYGASLGDLNGLGLPAAALQQSRETIDGALLVARGLAESNARALVDRAREAFVHAFAIGATLCGGLSLLYAFVGHRLLRHHPGPSAAADPQR